MFSILVRNEWEVITTVIISVIQSNSSITKFLY